MKKILILLAASLLATSCAHAAKLTFSLTAPTMNNDAADCASAPVLVAGSDQVTVVWRVGTAVTDSVTVARGTRISRTYSLPAGNYAVTVLVARQTAAGRFYSCPVTKSFEAVAPPDTAVVSQP